MPLPTCSATRLSDSCASARPLGAEARAELARTGLRRSAPGELTPSELRVAELAAAGLRNREIAEAAFMSPKTVEANLARVYRKLGINRAPSSARTWRACKLQGVKTY